MSPTRASYVLPPVTPTVATAVVEEEEEEDQFIPAAVEYDPESKPSLRKSKRFRAWAVGRG